ncbi:MAG: hypothetical protein JNG84_02855, partial [Archangium sp.]|nr:hypothetical protein [Archangium sp.]
MKRLALCLTVLGAMAASAAPAKPGKGKPKKAPVTKPAPELPAAPAPVVAPTPAPAPAPVAGPDAEGRIKLAVYDFKVNNVSVAAAEAFNSVLADSIAKLGVFQVITPQAI